MKNNNPIFFLLGLFLFVGCSSDSNGTAPPGNGNVVDRSANLLATGASANELLSNTDFERLTIEIGHVAGFQPTSQTMANFETFIRERTFKENIDIVLTSLESPNKEILTLEEIVDLEGDNRTAYNNGTTLAVYIYFADAPSTDDDGNDENVVTLGAVYRNTSMVIYESSIRNLANSSAVVTVTDLETATLNHEFGHLFGLVNLGTDAVNEHEDTESQNHCSVEGCLMRAEIQFRAAPRNSQISSKTNAPKSACSLNGKYVMQLLESKTAMGTAIVPRLDDECILDLRNNGGR